MCHACPDFDSSRRHLLLTLALGGLTALPSRAQVQVGPPSVTRKLVPAETLEKGAEQEYKRVLAEAQARRALLPPSHPQVQRLQQIAKRLLPHAMVWNDRARGWRWELEIINSPEINAWCMPGGKISFYSGILEKLQLSDDEVAMVMGHEMAHALREHAREQMAKNGLTRAGISLGSQLLGLGQIGQTAANLGGQLLSLKYSRDDETEADLVGLEIAARGGYRPEASVSLWKKMLAANGKAPLSFLSTHPGSDKRIATLQSNIPKVAHLYKPS